MNIDKYLHDYYGGSITIHPENTKVIFTGENGYDSDRNRILSEGVKVGDILTVCAIEIQEWSSTVLLEEIPGWHNTVCFDDVSDML